MGQISVTFTFHSGVKQHCFQNVRLSGSWDSSGMFAGQWTQRPMVAGIDETGCDAFNASVSLDSSQVGTQFQWGIIADLPGAPNSWVVVTEISDPDSGLRVRSFALSVSGGHQDYWFATGRRFGAQKYVPPGVAAPGIRFTVWAPYAQSVEIVFAPFPAPPAMPTGYIADDGTGIDPAAPVVPLSQIGTTGVWETSLADTPAFADFSAFLNRLYMYRVVNEQGNTTYKVDIFSRSQVGRGYNNPNGAHFEGSYMDLDGIVSCSVVSDPDLLTKDFDDTGLVKNSLIPADQFWSNEMNPGKPIPRAIEDLVIYELHIGSLGFPSTAPGTLAEAMTFLDQLVDLGVNAVELLPIEECDGAVQWGYGTSLFFCMQTSQGGGNQLKHFIRACHQRGIAVILDVVYGHSDGAAFAYARVYDDTGLPNPMMQTPNRDIYGRGFDHSLAFTRQYFLEANRNWLDTYHVDGFRYDNVPGFYDGNPLEKYGTLVFNTYLLSRGMARFHDPGGFSRIIQVAEDLDAPQDILRQTFTSATWQDALLGKARQLAGQGGAANAEDFAHLLDPSFGPDPYPDSQSGAPAGDSPFPVAPFQYLNSHDHSWLITTFGLEPPLVPDDIRFGDRSNFYKLQPYAIALLSAKGIPMLWEGEELAENYQVADGGNIRISFLRGMHWEYFYDANGNPLVRVYRRMGKLRRALPALRSRDYFYYSAESRPGEGVIAFRRASTNPAQIAIVALNFSDFATSVTVPAPSAGSYREMLDPAFQAPGAVRVLTAAKAGDPLEIAITSWYGRVFVTPPPADI